MRKINLREWYPDYYKEDTYVEVPDEVIEAMQECARQEAALRRRIYYHRAFYSLDWGDGIEYEAHLQALSPWEVYEQKVTKRYLHAAISKLPGKQAKRLMAHYFLGMSKSEIAKAEGVNKSQITRSIERALVSLGKTFKNLQ